ncbi:hypothetical protein [Acaryochloris thomasi]|uniref:hypothetical protein n=1 Tax=Acaryochloris thomasi TaxID=2929456 RepID=UPI0011B540FC|nr:hypothetical protein [Acaryochloris thomasi]
MRMVSGHGAKDQLLRTSLANSERLRCSGWDAISPKTIIPANTVVDAHLLINRELSLGFCIPGTFAGSPKRVRIFYR